MTLEMLPLIIVVVAVVVFALPPIRQKVRENKAKSSYKRNAWYEPRGDRVIVRRLPPPEPKDGEVFLPDSQKKPLNEGIVVAVGPGMRNRVTGEIDAVGLEPGDHVCFVDYAGFDIDVDGDKYLSMRDEEIHGRRRS